MTPQQLLAQLKNATQAGRFAYLQKSVNAKLVQQKPVAK